MESRVFITGIGSIIAPDGIDGKVRKIDAEEYTPLLEGVDLWNIDRISQITLAAALKALSESGVRVSHQEIKEYSLIIGTGYSALGSIHEFDMVSVAKGALKVNPGLFPNTVLNSPVCQVGIQLGFTGVMFTVTNGFTSSLDALGLSYRQIKSGNSSLVLSGGVDEYSELIPFMDKGNPPFKEACMLFVLENGDRQGDVSKPYYAEILEHGTVFFHEKKKNNAGVQLDILYREVLDRSRLLPGDINEIYINTPFSMEQNRQLQDSFVQSIDFAGNCTLSVKNHIGATGAVQLQSILLSISPVGNNGNVALINMDKGKISILLIKRAPRD